MNLFRYFLFVSLLLFLPTASYTNISYDNPPPVEKVKKKKKAKKQRHFKLKKTKKQEKHQVQTNEDLIFVTLITLTVLFTLFVILMAIFFNVGFISALFAFLFIGGGSLIAYLAGTLMIGDQISNGGYATAFLYWMTFGALYILNIVLGILFLVLGLTMGIPLLWGLGILLFAIFLIAFIIHALVFWGNMWMD